MFPPNTRILILDDMSTMRKVVTKALKDIGFTDIQEAADGIIGWNVLTNSTPAIQLIISDWNMPNCTGLDLLKKVRADPKYAAIPFILLTAEAEITQVKEALAQGVSNYVTKPFTADTLRQKIEQVHKKMAG
jgi:two-component system chemotaxis response regulator CheY